MGGTELTMTSLPQHQRESETLFDERAGKSYANGGFLTIDYGDHWEVDADTVKAFLLEREALAYERGREEMLGSVREIAGKMRKDEAFLPNTTALENGVKVLKDVSFNAGLSSLLQALEEKK